MLQDLGDDVDRLFFVVERDRRPGPAHRVGRYAGRDAAGRIVAAVGFVDAVSGSLSASRIARFRWASESLAAGGRVEHPVREQPAAR